MLQLRKDLLSSVFGQERATALLEQVASSVRDRDLLLNSLLQRKSKLQVSISGCLLGGARARHWRWGPLFPGGGRPCVLTSAPALATVWPWARPFVAHNLSLLVYKLGKIIV